MDSSPSSSSHPALAPDIPETSKSAIQIRAVFSLVFGILSNASWGLIFGFLAMVLGLLEVQSSKSSKPNSVAAHFAVAGIILGAIGALRSLLSLFLGTSIILFMLGG